MCRLTSGRVPRPIEPKPIITIGPLKRAWTGWLGIWSLLQNRGLTRPAGPTEQTPCGIAHGVHDICDAPTVRRARYGGLCRLGLRQPADGGDHRRPRWPLGRPN